MRATLISVDEYLKASYRPDCEYVDGEVLERNVGEWDHSRLQTLLLKFLLRYEDETSLLVVAEQRVQVKATRFRIPDLTVVRGKPGEQILTRPPLLCIEVLSPRDSMQSIQERVDDYLAFGVENIWIFNPREKRAYRADKDGVHDEEIELETAGAEIRI